MEGQRNVGKEELRKRCKDGMMIKRMEGIFK